MTLDDLSAIPPEDINKMSEADLMQLLAPLFPQARAPFAGKKEQRIIAAPGRYISRKAMDDKVAQLLKMVENQKKGIL